jgi:transmembrane sensor
MGVFGNWRRGTSARRQAVKWIYRLAKPNVSESEKAQCVAWLDSSPEHRHEFLLASALLDLQSKHRGLPPIHSVLERLDAATSEASVSQARHRVRLPNRPARLRAGVAVIALIGVAVTALVMFSRESAQSYVTGVGENRKVVLQDGSTVQLNTDSHVQMTFAHDRREARLTRGEARFDVQYDAQRSFDVIAPCGTVRALSTQFVVYVRPNGTCDLIVEAGRVRATGGAAEQQLVTAREMAFISRDIDLRQLTGAELRQRLAWVHGLLMFENTRLADAVAQFNRYNTTQLVLGDPSLEDLAIGGRFIATRARTFAAALRAVRIKAVESANGRVITLFPATAPVAK